MDSNNNYEIEVKFKVNDFTKLRNDLKKINAISNGNTFEQNYCFDDQNFTFKQKDHILRLRKVNDKVILTFKGAKEFEGHLKKREEIELELSDFERMKIIFERIGLNLRRIYEKKRENYLLNNVKVILEIVPFTGKYIELEGDAEEINQVMKLLKLKKEDACDYTYGPEAEEWYKKGYQLTFEEEEKYNGR